MRLVTALLCLLAIAGCKDRRSFDQRYEDAGATIEQRARALDEKIANEQQPAGNDTNSS